MPTPEQRERAIALGKCRECFKRKARKNKKTCGKCSKASIARVQRSRNAKKGIPCDIHHCRACGARFPNKEQAP